MSEQENANRPGTVRRGLLIAAEVLMVLIILALLGLIWLPALIGNAK